MARIILSPDVEEDLLVIADSIADDNPDAADRFIEAASSTFTRLSQFPGMGRDAQISRVSSRGTPLFSGR